MTGGGLGKKERCVLSDREKQILRRKEGTIPNSKDYENRLLNNEFLYEFCIYLSDIHLVKA